jgi:PAS domain S-box-containing protein
MTNEQNQSINTLELFSLDPFLIVISSMQDYFSILDCSFEAGILVDDSGVILYANTAAKQMFGMEDDDNHENDSNDSYESNDSYDSNDSNDSNVMTIMKYHLDSIVSLKSTPILIDDEVYTTWQDFLIADKINSYSSRQSSEPPIEFLAACNDISLLTEFLGHVRLTLLSNRMILAYIRMTDNCENLTQQPMDLNITIPDQDKMYYQDDELTIQKGDGETMPGSEDPYQLDYTTDSVMDLSLDPIFHVTSSGVILLANESASKLFGFSANELRGRNFMSLLMGGNSSSTLTTMTTSTTTHDNFHIQNYFNAEGTDTRTMKNIVWNARRKDGTEFPIDLVLAEIDSSDDNQQLYCVFVHDLTEVKARERELLHRQQLYQGIIECSLDPVFQINSQGIIEMVNQAAVTLFGYGTKDDLVGKNFSTIFTKEQATRYVEKFHHYLHNTEAQQGTILEKRRELLAKRKDNTEILVEFTLTEIPTTFTNNTDNHHERVFVGFFYDLTATKKFLANEVEKVATEALAIMSPLTKLVDMGL